jgi:serine/threonine-protein kinase
VSPGFSIAGGDCHTLALTLVKICPRCSELLPDDAAFCPADGAPLAKATDPLLGRTIAARYRIMRRLGAGGMANVYLARHVIIERMSAIKVLRQDLALNPASRERFLREARAVNRINHPNIVEITDYGEFEGMAYLVMEYVEGESLLALLKRGALSWPRAAHLGAQVASALGRAHQMGVIHRDLKPENVIVVGPPEKAGTRDEIVKLTDFGIAKIVDAPRLTFSEQMFGTPGYIAPEYIEGAPADARADLYALGVVIYEMLTACLPYDARTQAEKLVKPLSSPPVPPRQRVAGLPTELESLVLRLLARRPEDRPRDAFAVVDALHDVLRRYANSSLRPPPLETGEARRLRSSEPPKSSPTLVVDVIPANAPVPSLGVELQPTANVGGLPTGEIAMRWSGPLNELEATIAARSKEGGGTFASDRASELAGVAREMVFRVERAQRVVADAQAKLDRLEAEGRDFRANLGHAIDSLVHDRSRERAHLEAVTSRKAGMEEGGSPVSGTPQSIETRLWEHAALAAELDRAQKVDQDLSFQIDSLQKQLESKNETFDREMVGAAGALEGSLGALRRLTNELVRTLDEAAVIVGAERTSRPSLTG